MSAGGELNYEFALWKPERVIGFVVNKGGIYYAALADEAAREVPGLFFIGENDLTFRNDIIRGIYSINRRARALGALMEKPDVAHEVARSRDGRAVLPRAHRIASAGNARIARAEAERRLCLRSKSKHCTAAADASERRYPTAWLPTESLARAWRAVTMGTPF